MTVLVVAPNFSDDKPLEIVIDRYSFHYTVYLVARRVEVNLTFLIENGFFSVWTEIKIFLLVNG